MEIVRGSLYLLHAPHRIARPLINTIIADLALAGRVRVLDGGNRFDIYGSTREIRRRSEAVEEILQRVEVARAFTCYQMTALLTECHPNIPILVLDILTTFGDENVDSRERARLFQHCLSQMRRLCHQAPLLVTASAGKADLRDDLLLQLEESSDRVWKLEPYIPQAQPRLL